MAKKIAWGGIDPGLSGCACLLTTDKIWFHDFISEEKASAILDQWQHEFRVKFLLEKQVDVRKPGFNVKGKLLINYGFWRGCLYSYNCNFVTLTAQQWQKVMPGKRQKSETTKDRALMYAIKYYPAASGMLDKKKDHNRADALLMAHYLRQIEIGG